MLKMKKNSSKGLQISDKDKNLLFGVGIVAVVFLGYNFLLSPKYESIKVTNSELKTVLSKRDDLKAKFENLPNLKAENEQLKHTDQRMKVKVPQFNSLPHSLSILFAAADARKIQVASITDNGEQRMTLDQFLKSDNAQATDNQANSSQYVAKNNFNVIFSGDFKDIYDFIKDIENNDRKFYINSLTLNDAKIGGLSANMNLSTVSYVDSNVPVECPYKIEDLQGRANIFTTTPGVENLSQDATYYTPEYFMNINSSQYEGAKVLFMENGKFDTEVFSNSDKETVGTLNISGNENNITATCTLGKITKTINSQIVLKDNTIRMTVLSNPRVTPEDVVQLKLNVNNNTKYNFEITVVNDDQFNPKFVLNNPKDNVIVKGVTR